MEWLIKHLGGIILPFGEFLNKGIERSFFVAGSEGGLMKAAKAYLYLATPVLGLLFFFASIGTLF